MGASVPAIYVSSSLMDVLASTARGAVLAVFERSAYLDLNGRIAALVSAELGRGPLTIGLDRFDALRPLVAGDPVSLHDGGLRVGSHIVPLRNAAVWDPALPPAKDGQGADTAVLEVVLDEIRHGARAESIAALLDERAALLDPLRQGLQAIADFLSGHADDDQTTYAVATQIAGRGPGLTPSGDDLLIGIMHAITIWPRIAAAAGGLAARRVLGDAARAKTTRISAAYLDAACRGLASEPWHALIRSLGGSHTAARRAVRLVLAVGETSGADALTGFCWAWRRLPA